MKISFLFIISFLCVFLSGCVLPPSVFSTDLPTLKGKPIKVAIHRLGYPTSEGNIMGEKFYLWSTTRPVYFSQSNVSTSNGMIAGSPFNVNTTTFGGGTTKNLSCNIRIFVNKKNLITHYDVDGTVGGCGGYEQKMLETREEN